LKAHIARSSITFALLLGLSTAQPSDINDPESAGRDGSDATVVSSDLPLLRSPIRYASDPTKGSAEAVVIADVNADHKPDLLVAHGCGEEVCDSKVGVLLGLGNGRFQPVVLYSSGGSGSSSLAVADVNRDGKLDVVVTHCHPLGDGNCPVKQNGTVGILLGNGNGTFQPPTNYDAGGFASWSVATGDLNGDGKLDLVVANRGSTLTDGSVAVLLGNGDGTFQSPVTYPVHDPVSVTIADLNRDGKQDVVVACVESPSVIGIMLGDGNGILHDPIFKTSGGIYTWGVTVGDLNGDGKPDIAAASACPLTGCTNTSVGSAGVLIGRGDGTFRSTVSYPTGVFGAVKVAIADINGDGKPDLVVANDNSGTNIGSVGILRGNGNGTFQTALNYGTGGAVTTSVATADVNADGRTDVVATNRCFDRTHNCNVGGGVSVLLKATYGTTTVVTSSSPSSVAGQALTFTATVTSQAALIPDGEAISFYDSGVLMGDAPLTSGTATFTTASWKAKSHTIKATYPGDPTFNKSSGSVTQIVVP